MLQRIQSVLLLLTALGMAAFLLLHSWDYSSGDQTIFVNALHVAKMKGSLAEYDKPVYYIAILAVLSIVLSLFSIFQYKNRVRQMMFVALNSLLIGVALAFTVYHVKNDAMLMIDNGGEGNFTYGLYAGFAALAFNWVANRFIRRDEKLVKDADRMR